MWRGLVIIVEMGFVVFTSPVFSEHGAAPTKRPKVASRASECKQSEFEAAFGLVPLETQVTSGSISKGSYPLVPIEPVSERRYGGAMGSSWSYDVVTAWRYKAPDDRVFRLAASQSLSCFLDGQTESAYFLEGLLKQENLFKLQQPNPGKLKTDEASRPEDVRVFNKMRELFESMRALMAEHKSDKGFPEFFQALLKQVQANEVSLLSKNPQIEIQPELIKQLEKLRTEASDKLLEFVRGFSQTPEFDYWLHPMVANFFRKALNDPGFSLKSSDSMTSAQAQDLGREFQQILRGARTPGDVPGPSLIDALQTQSKIRFIPNERGGETVLETPKMSALLNSELEQLAGRLKNPDERKTAAAIQEAAQALSRALNDRNAAFSGSLSPEHLALKDAAQGALAVLSQDKNAAAQATELEGEEARTRNDTDRKVLSPLRSKLEAALSGHQYPISLRAVDKTSKYPDSVKELIQAVTRRLEPQTLSRSAQANLADFLQTGETQHLVDLLFKNRDAFDGAVGFLRGAKEASPGDQALLRATSLLSQLDESSFKPSSKWADEYAYTRRLLKDSINRLGQDPSREKDRDAHLLALRLLDETGLVGITDRDTKERNSYLPEILYQELKAEQAALNKACEDDTNKKDCLQKIERSLMEKTHEFIGTPIGLTSEMRRSLIENPDVQLRRFDHLTKGSPLRQAALFAGIYDPESVAGLQTSDIPNHEQQQRVYRRDDKEESQSDLEKKLPDMLRHRTEAAKTASDLALKLSMEFALADASVDENDSEKATQLKLFYRCLSERLSEQASGYNNPLAIRALSEWYSSPEAPGQSARLKIASAQLQCNVPDGVEEVFLPPRGSGTFAQQKIQDAAKELELLDGKDRALSPSKQSEKALILLEHLRRLEMDLKREKLLFGEKGNRVFTELQTKKRSLIQEIKELGLSEVLNNPEMKKLLSPPDDKAFLTREELGILERDYHLPYDSNTNSFLLSPETKVDERLLQFLSRAQGINLQYFSPGRETPLFLKNGGNDRSLLALMSHEAGTLGISPGASGTAPWFPFTNSTSSRLIEKEGVIKPEFISTERLSEEARKKMEALIQARTDSHSAASRYSSLGHAAKAYFGHMVGFDPNQTSEAQELQKTYSKYAELRSAFGAIGIAPIAGTQMTSDEFNRNELQMMRDYLHREEEAIHGFLTNVETLHSLSEMALTAAMPVGPVLALEAKLARLAAGTGKVALAARQALRATRLALQFRKATRSGLNTAKNFEIVSIIADGGLSLLPDSTNAIIEDRIKRAKDGHLEEGWRKHPENPAFDSKWGALDKTTGQPVDPNLRNAFLQAMLEFNIEESMDVDGDGVIDELQGEGGTPVPFAKRRGFVASVTDPHRLEAFADSAAFFRNLGLAKSLPVPRWITLPTEMAVAGALQEATRSRESLRWEEKQTGKDPGSLAYRVGKSALSSFVEGGRFGLSGTVSNAALTKMVGGKASGFNTFLGASLFTAVDIATKAAVNQVEYGYTGLERGSWEETLRDLIRENSVTFYIGMDIAKSGLARREFQDLKTAYLEGGEQALRKALKDPNRANEVVQTIMASINPQEFASASPNVQGAHLRLLEARVNEGNARLEAAQRAALRAGEEVITAEDSYRVGQINRDLFRLFREGSWNHAEQIGKLLTEQDQIFSGITERLEQSQNGLQKLQARLTEEAASSDPQGQVEFERRAKALEAHQEMVNNLTEAAARMAPLRVLAEPVETIAALSNPRSSFAQTHFEDRPAALAAIQRYQKSVGEKAWEALSNFGDTLAKEHIGPDLRRDDSGQAGLKRLLFGARPSASISGREQRAAAEFAERVFKDKTTSLQEKRELLGIILQLDPARADALARSLPTGAK